LGDYTDLRQRSLLLHSRFPPTWCNEWLGSNSSTRIPSIRQKPCRAFPSRIRHLQSVRSPERFVKRLRQKPARSEESCSRSVTMCTTTHSGMCVEVHWWGRGTKIGGRTCSELGDVADEAKLIMRKNCFVRKSCVCCTIFSYGLTPVVAAGHGAVFRLRLVQRNTINSVLVLLQRIL
jgi:hypothetical protein